MTATRFRNAGITAFCLLASVVSIEAHSWVEELRVVASNGTWGTQMGFPRAYVPRTSSAFSDVQATYMVPPDGGSNAFTTTQNVCAPDQTIGSQTAGSPMLSASAGDNLALIYQENGHVTALGNTVGFPPRPAGAGVISIYGIKTPTNDDKFLGVKQWTADGKGGDGRGKLLATRNFDDGRCFQDNDWPITQARRQKFNQTADPNSYVRCQSTVQLPVDAGASGTYTLYWIWDYPQYDPKNTSQLSLNQSYTTCMDIGMTASVSNTKAINNAGAFDTKQNIQTAAIQGQISKAMLVDVNPGINGGVEPLDPADALILPNGDANSTAISLYLAATSTALPSVAPSSTATGGLQFEPSSTTVKATSTGAPPASSVFDPTSSGFVTVTITEKPAPVTVTVTATVQASNANDQPATSSPRSRITRTTTSTTEATSKATAAGSPVNSKAPSSSVSQVAAVSEASGQYSVATSAPPTPSPFLAMTTKSVAVPSTPALAASCKTSSSVPGAAAASGGLADGADAAVSAPSGKYTHPLSVPTPSPFLTKRADAQPTEIWSEGKWVPLARRNRRVRT